MTFLKYKDLLETPPQISGPNVRVWKIRQDETIRINLVEMTGELRLHQHPDADHSLLVLTGQVRVLSGETLVIANPGDFISVPAGVPHKYWSLTEKSVLVSMDAPYYDPSKTVELE